ncbi:hypothetical protein [Bryobacter aggregatus]|uniref:hypothetical protein n=1 Tax=Bryobacter aggregatus TaxID=360054 RepID=UPI0004E1BD3A|nr:hypothetical protein [Bryobacter aggregatus]
MSWNLIKSIQKDTDLRLIMPFGLNLRLGDIISVNRKSGDFTLEGSSASILEIPVAGVRQAQTAGVDLFQQSGNDVSMKFRGKGAASSFFPDLAQANAGFDISFQSANSWLLALVNRKITVLEELDRFRQAILTAYHWGVWKPDWVLVHSLATVDRMTLIASSSGGTNVALSISGNVDVAAPAELKLTAGVSIAATNKALIQSIVADPSSAFCSGLRVRDHWWSHPEVDATGALGYKGPIKPIAAASAEEFWEDADALS